MNIQNSTTTKLKFDQPTRENQQILLERLIPVTPREFIRGRYSLKELADALVEAVEPESLEKALWMVYLPYHLEVGARIHIFRGYLPGLANS